jgi:hypothetical protein
MVRLKVLGQLKNPVTLSGIEHIELFKTYMGQVFSEYFGFPCQSSFHQFLHNHPHLSFGAGTVGQ